MKRTDTQFSEHFPEILWLDDEAEREKAAKFAKEGASRSWRLWLVCFSILIVILVAVESAERSGWRPVWLPSWLLNAGGIAGLVCPALFFWLMLVMRGSHIARRLREYLNDHGVPVCMKCGYSLRGLDQARCPECGRSFDDSRATDKGAPNSRSMDRTEYRFPSGDRDA